MHRIQTERERERQKKNEEKMSRCAQAVDIIFGSCIYLGKTSNTQNKTNKIL